MFDLRKLNLLYALPDTDGSMEVINLKSEVEQYFAALL